MTPREREEALMPRDHAAEAQAAANMTADLHTGYEWAWEVCSRNRAKALRTNAPMPGCADCERRARKYATALHAARQAGFDEGRKGRTADNLMKIHALGVEEGRQAERAACADFVQEAGVVNEDAHLIWLAETIREGRVPNQDARPAARPEEAEAAIEAVETERRRVFDMFAADIKTIAGLDCVPLVAGCIAVVAEINRRWGATSYVDAVATVERCLEEAKVAGVAQERTRIEHFVNLRFMNESNERVPLLRDLLAGIRTPSAPEASDA